MLRSFFGIRSLTLCVAIAMGTLGFAASSAGAALDLHSTFDTGAEGWTVDQGDGNGATDATWMPGTGNGFIRFTDADSNELANGCCFGFFVSPRNWAGDATNNYGGTLSFADRGSVLGDDNTPPVVILTGPQGRCMSHQFNGSTGTSFSTFSISLDTSDLHDCFDGGTSELEVVDLLSHLSEIDINVDDSASAGETEDLDNVSLSGGGPPPRVKITRSLTLAYSRKQKILSGELSAPALPDCAAKQSVRIYRVHKGPDKQVASGKTSASGSYVLGAPSKSGRYYASAPASKKGIANCAAVRSPKVKIG